jgi:L-alanine-DL-glutamate epimerase-like enolase superfamily enzyme
VLVADRSRQASGVPSFDQRDSEIRVELTGIEAFPVWGGKRNYLSVVVDTDESLYRVGETGFTGRELAVTGAIEHVKPPPLGKNPIRSEHLWQLLFRGGFFPARHAVSAAISAVDLAIWNIKGEALGVPVYELLGGRARDRVVCYPHNAEAGMDESALVESCLKTKEEGWRFVRWGLPQEGGVFETRRSVRVAIEQLAAVRDAVGEEVEMILDVHTRLEMSDSLRLCREAEPSRPFFIEDPLRSEDPGSYEMLRLRTTVPLAAGEQFGSKWEFRTLVEKEWIDYARVDLCIAGGITEAKKIAAICEAHHVRLAVHNPLGPISTAACLHLNLSLSNFGVQEQPYRPGTFLPDVVPVQPGWEDGHLLPPTRPGLGVHFDREAAKGRPFRMTELPHLRRPDGSVTNW